MGGAANPSVIDHPAHPPADLSRLRLRPGGEWASVMLNARTTPISRMGTRWRWLRESSRPELLSTVRFRVNYDRPAWMGVTIWRAAIAQTVR